VIDIRIERGHVTASVAANLLGVSRQRVNQLLKQGRITGAFLMDCGDGREVWVVPRNSLDTIRYKRKRKESP
jgi:plasmid maintenance system antidote protein VapI